MRRKTIIEISQDVAIGNGYILEKGDVIEVLKEDENGVYGADATYQYPAEGEDLTDETGKDNLANIKNDPFTGKSLEGDRKESVKNRKSVKEMEGDGDAQAVVNKETGAPRAQEGDPADAHEDSVEVAIDSTIVPNFANADKKGKADLPGGADDAADKAKAKAELEKNGDLANSGKKIDNDDAGAKSASKAEFLKGGTAGTADITNSTGRDNLANVKSESRFYTRRLVLK